MSYRFAFEPYIAEPEKHPDVVIFYDSQVIIIKDGFPKSVRHWLVIPRDKNLTRQEPLLALAQEKNYSMLKPYVDKAKTMMLNELQTEYGGEWLKFVKCGIHAVPSLANLHIHVVLQDFNSSRMKHKKHYNSFTTSFFVPFENFSPTYPSGSTFQPSGYKRKKLEHLLRAKTRTGYGSASDSDLDQEPILGNEEEEKEDNGTEISEDSKEVSTINSRNNAVPIPFNQVDDDSHAKQGTRNSLFVYDKEQLTLLLKTSPMKCTYCHKSFGNSFQALKKHLQEEFKNAYGPSS